MEVSTSTSSLTLSPSLSFLSFLFARTSIPRAAGAVAIASTDDVIYARQLMVESTMEDDSHAPMLLGATGSLLVIAVLLLVARFWSRLRSMSTLHADDWSVVAATLLAMVKYILVCLACHHGFGRRSLFVPLESRSAALHLLFACQVIWQWAIMLVKISVSLLLYRLKPGRGWRIFLIIIMSVLVVNAIVQTFFQFLQCRPYRIYWDPSVFMTGKVKCVPRAFITGNIIAGSVVHVSSDLVLSFIPITFIRKLNRPRGEKIFLGVLMALGLFAALFAILRTVELQNFYKSQDIFRTSVQPTLWSMLEQETALIAATIPMLKAFMQRSLIRIGHFFYSQESETQVRDRLVEMGFLGEKEELPGEMRRKPSKPDIEVASFGSPTSPRRIKDEFGDTFDDVTLIGDTGMRPMARRS